MISTIVRIKLQDITVNSCIRLYQYNVRSSSRPALRHLLLLIFLASRSTVLNKYSAFRCKSGYKSKGCVQGRAQFTFHAYPVHDEDLCAKWTKANPRKDYVPCAVESFTVYTCSSYYRRCIRITHYTVVVAKSCTH